MIYKIFNHKTLLILSFIGLNACYLNPKPDRITDLQIAVIPDQNRDSLKRKYLPLINYLTKTINIKTTLVQPTSYENLLHLFATKQVDLVLFDGVTYLKARKNNNAIPVVIRSVDKIHSSVFFVRKDSGIRNLQDAKNKSLTLNSKLSASGYYMPKYFLKKLNIDFKHHFSGIRYSGAHDTTAQWVLDGSVDVGVAQSTVIDEMIKNGRLDKKDITIIWETPIFPDYIWAVREQVSTALRNKIHNAFILIDIRNASQKSILDNSGGGFYLTAQNTTFKMLKHIVFEHD